jgi:hypothetical protein
MDRWEGPTLGTKSGVKGMVVDVNGDLSKGSRCQHTRLLQDAVIDEKSPSAVEGLDELKNVRQDARKRGGQLAGCCATRCH